VKVRDMGRAFSDMMSHIVGWAGAGTNFLSGDRPSHDAVGLESEAA